MNLFSSQTDLSFLRSALRNSLRSRAAWLGLLLLTAGGSTRADDVFFMAGQSNAKSPIAQGIRDLLRAAKNPDGTPTYQNVKMVWSNQNGSAIRQWYNGTVTADGKGITEGAYGKFYGYQMYHGSSEVSPPVTVGLLEQAMNAAPTPPSQRNVFRGFFWWQGEGDSSPPLAKCYAAKFRGMLAQLGKDVNAPCGKDTWTYHLALPWNRPTDMADPGKFPHFKLIRAAQIEMVNEDREFATYFDTKVYDRNYNRDAQGFATDNEFANPHTPIGKGYEIGLEMGKQFLRLHGKTQAEVENYVAALNAPAKARLTRLNDESNDTYGHPHGKVRHQVLAFPTGWSPAGRPGPGNTVLFPDTLTSSRIYDLGAPLRVQGLVYSAAQETTLDYDNEGIGIFEPGAAGLDASAARSRLVLNCSVKTVAPQIWTVNAGQAVQFNNARSVYDLTQARLMGPGTFEFRAGTFHLGAQANTANLSFVSGGPLTVTFAAATPAGTVSPLGKDGAEANPLRLGKTAALIYNPEGTGSQTADWDRKITFDPAAAGSKCAFEVANARATFISTGRIGPAADTANTTLNLKLGGAGNLQFAGTGGVAGSANPTMICNLEKSGAGTVTFAGTGNSFNGSLAISAGTLRVASAASVNRCTGITVGTGTNASRFEYFSTVPLERPVTVNVGSTFTYGSAAPLKGALTLAAGATVILDGPLEATALSVPAKARLVLTEKAGLPAHLKLINEGTLDRSKWNGTLPPDLVNHGEVLDR